MSRWSFIITEASRARILEWVRRAPVGFRIELKEAKRSDAQNRLMWPLLTEISAQLLWHGQKYSPDDWKDFMMHQLGNGRWMPAEEGGMIPIGMRTSDLGKTEFSDLIEVIRSFAARQGIELHDEHEVAA
jgi:hypothetical protein